VNPATRAFHIPGTTVPHSLFSKPQAIAAPRVASTAREENMTPMQSAQRPHEAALPIPTDPLKAFIQTRLARNEMPRQIADAVKLHLGIDIDRDHVIPFWKGEITLPTQTERRQDKESVQIPADEVDESLFTRMPCGETPDAMPPMMSEAVMPEAAIPEAATLTGPLQNQKSTMTPPDETTAFTVSGLACLDDPSKRAEAVKANLGIETDRAQALAGSKGQDARPTLTGPLQNQKTTTTLTNEIKQFIVKALACFDTPSDVAEAVKANFGIAVTRQHVHIYNPDGAQPPALRWRELHAATRQAFLREMSEIGVVHKAVRLRMLDRLAHRCERNNVALALDCLEQAAKECGGMYESRKAAAVRKDHAPEAAPLQT
jgi:hypothetical protein